MALIRKAQSYYENKKPYLGMETYNDALIADPTNVDNVMRSWGTSVVLTQGYYHQYYSKCETRKLRGFSLYKYEKLRKNATYKWDSFMKDLCMKTYPNITHSRW